MHIATLSVFQTDVSHNSLSRLFHWAACSSSARFVALASLLSKLFSTRCELPDAEARFCRASSSSLVSWSFSFCILCSSSFEHACALILILQDAALLLHWDGQQELVRWRKELSLINWRKMESEDKVTRTTPTMKLSPGGIALWRGSQKLCAHFGNIPKLDTRPGTWQVLMAPWLRDARYHFWLVCILCLLMGLAQVHHLFSICCPDRGDAFVVPLHLSCTHVPL